MATLYQITDEIKELGILIDQMMTDEEGNQKELSEDDKNALLALVDEIQSDFSGKAERICRFLRNVESDAESCKTEETRLSKLRKSAENKAKNLKWILETCMYRAGIEKIDAGTFKLAIQKNPPSVFISRLDAVPEEYFRIIPETKEPDKKKMLEAMKEGTEIPGAMISQGSSLRIR